MRFSVATQSRDHTVQGPDPVRGGDQIDGRATRSAVRRDRIERVEVAEPSHATRSDGPATSLRRSLAAPKGTRPLQILEEVASGGRRVFDLFTRSTADP